MNPRMPPPPVGEPVLDAEGRIAAPWIRWFSGLYQPGVVNWTAGAGSPEGVLTAPVGSLYTRTDGGASTTLYVKESGDGNTGWAAK